MSAVLASSCLCPVLNNHYMLQHILLGMSAVLQDDRFKESTKLAEEEQQAVSASAALHKRDLILSLKKVLVMICDVLHNQHIV